MGVIETYVGYSRRVLSQRAKERSVRRQLPRWQSWLSGRLRLRLVLRYVCGRRFSFSSGLDVEDNDLVGFAAVLAPANLHRSFQLQSVLLADWAVDEPAPSNRLILLDRLHLSLTCRTVS